MKYGNQDIGFHFLCKKKKKGLISSLYKSCSYCGCGQLLKHFGIELTCDGVVVPTNLTIANFK
jgi:hypothetical protein